MTKFYTLLLVLFLGSGYAACSTVSENIRAEYASGMFEAFITQSYGKSTIAFCQFDLLTGAVNRRQYAPARQSQIEEGVALVLNEEHHCQKARATRKIDLAKPQQAECLLFTAPVNSQGKGEKGWGKSAQNNRDRKAVRLVQDVRNFFKSVSRAPNRK